MNNTLKTIIGIALAAGLFGTACSDQSNESRAATDNGAAGQTAAAEGSEAGGSTGGSAETYEAVLVKVRALEQTASSATSREAAMRAVGEMEALFTGFIDEHPDAAEANDARFQLGTLYFALQQLDKSIAYMAEFLNNSGGQKSDKVGYAHYYLGEAYKSADRFEKAKKHYAVYVEEYGDLNRQLLANVTTSLADLDTMKKLAIGGDPIPFDVKGIDGKQLTLEKYRGKVVLIDFWATWCGPCRVEMPNVVRIHKKYRDKGFEIIGVSLDRDRAAFDKYIKSTGMVWPQYFDGAGWNNSVAAKYKVRSIPATYLIDRRGKIRYRSLRGKELEQAVAELVKERA